MIWYVLMQIFNILLTGLRLKHQSTDRKDLEILILRHQLSVLSRKYDQVVRPSRSERLILAVLMSFLKQKTHVGITDLRNVIRIVQPETVLKWHQELVRRKWTFQRHKRGGRPPIDPIIETLILRLVRENDWGYGKITGELMKLGHHVSEQTIANILKRHNLPPLPERKTSLSWKYLMTHYKQQLLACDFFTVETLFLKTIYVLFFIEIDTRRVHFSGCTAHPTQIWVTQQARQALWKLDKQEMDIRFLIHDRDTKFSASFDTLFQSKSIHIIKTPIQTPNANAYAERWVRSIREECLDKLLILNEKHLTHIMTEYVNYYNTARPHQGIQQNIPIAPDSSSESGYIQCRDVLGGIIHDYYRESA